MIVLTEAFDPGLPEINRHDLEAASTVAALLGHTVYAIPVDFARCGTAENAVAHIPTHPSKTPAIWLGYIPTQERYEAIHTALLQKGMHLLNTPEEHLIVQEFDRAYPRLLGLTPTSVAVTHIDQVAQAVEALGVPLFVKGAIQSRKVKGWKACVADTRQEAERLTQELLEQLPEYSRGRVLLRQLVKLRCDNIASNGFPLGREFRVLIYRQRVISYGYYWEVDDFQRWLSTPEEEEMFAIALEATRQLAVPFVAVDMGQLEDGSWTVIETGDPQFSGLTQMPLIQLWHELEQAVQYAA